MFHFNVVSVKVVFKRHVTSPISSSSFYLGVNDAWCFMTSLFISLSVSDVTLSEYNKTAIE